MHAYLTIPLILLATTQEESILDLSPVPPLSARLSYPTPVLIPQNRPDYPWKSHPSHLRQIDKEYFRCRGRSNHPPKTLPSGEIIFDCGGTDEHGLPSRDGQEWIYPVLIEVLNHIQDRTSREVVIQSGHRCPKHQNYLDPSGQGQHSKHMIGAEVAFYVKGFESRPEEVVDLIMSFYQDSNFKRWSKETDVVTPPWYNEEIFIKIYLPREGRSLDVGHDHAYLSVQVRFDRERGERVQYTWKGRENYFRT